MILERQNSGKEISSNREDDEEKKSITGEDVAIAMKKGPPVAAKPTPFARIT